MSITDLRTRQGKCFKSHCLNSVIYIKDLGGNRMKRFLAVLLVVVMVLSLAACGSKDNGGKNDSGSGSSNTSSGKTDTGKTDTGKTDTGKNDADSLEDIDMDAINDALSSLLGEDENMGTKFFQFPKAETLSKWPDSSVWEKMGMIDLTPRTCEEGEIYNDGQYYTEGLGWHGYSADCKAGTGDKEDLCKKLWDAGYRGIGVGNGIIVEADSMEELLDSEGGYSALYEYDGWVLCVQVNDASYTGKLYCSVYDANTMKDSFYAYEPKNPKISWPSANQQRMISDVGGIGSEFYGSLDDNNMFVYAENVSSDQFDAYIEKLQKLDGFYIEWWNEEDGWVSWDGAFEADYSMAIEVSYNAKAKLVRWNWYSY